ncbi:T9SS type A sorting domain-containing protein [uncultured Winogradskyella sp.]|uniref:T9SS type A sorting domain-containing protein n=1 Tax=Winogradskyella sp. 4-2091 TaxID=3381659 RepID=UPI002632F522|nr:T9SS type A sorting domain-containing protein [uncultured Winogradskyella sp.]
MKNITITIILLTLCCQLYSQTTAIPDANFEQALIDEGIDTNGLNGNILNVDAENTTSLILTNRNISDVSGIEAFTNLTTLYLSQNNLTTLDVTNNLLLGNLVCWDNNLSSITFAANTQLYNLACEENNLTSLDVSSLTSLSNLYCGDNAITTLDVSANTALLKLDIYNLALTELDLSSNNNLQDLYCDNNQLTTLNLSDKPSFKRLSCKNNALTELNISNGNNTNVTLFRTDGNSELNCITVDDEAYSTSNWANIDDHTSFSVSCDGSLSTTEINNDTSISVYPNPVKDQLNLSFPSTVDSIVIFNSLGELVAKTSNENHIDLTDLKTGLYVVKIQVENKTITKKILHD